MSNGAAHLVDRVLPDVPVRQYLVSLPYELPRLAPDNTAVAVEHQGFICTRGTDCHVANALGRSAFLDGSSRSA